MRTKLAAAAVDIGTNSILLTIARPDPRGRLLVLDERYVVTRLGRGLGHVGALNEEAISRTLAVLEEFGAAILALGAEARAVGTSALRRAENAEDFIAEATRALGFSIEILSGLEEARLGYRGALSDLDGVEESDEPIVLDPGGGSTEVVTSRGRHAVSLELGAVRLTEAFGLTRPRNAPPSKTALSELKGHVRDAVKELDPAAGRPVVGVGGTATTLAALALGLDKYDSARVHGMRLQLESIRSIHSHLATLGLEDREKIPCLPPGRADIAVAGGVLLEEVLCQLAVDELIVSDRGLRYGLITEIIRTW